jgi:heme oxygenase (biliverdin-IX-beta and delta-forming)
MLTEELKEVTADAHQAAEKKLITALKKIATTTDYMHMLNWLYGYYAPMEGLIRRFLTPDILPDIPKRSRAEYLLWDMKETGLPVLPPDICQQLPVIDSYPRALGALYVLEGSTLGGRIIAGMISQELDSIKSLSFFNGYGAETNRMWQSFKKFLNHPFPLIQRREIIAAAEDTFITFKNWIDKHELQPQV